MTTALRAAVEAAARPHAVPGMSAAVLRDGAVETAVHGVTHVGRPTPVTQTTAFGVQSVTKVLNAGLVLQVLADRLEDLDLPVTTWLEPRRFSRPDLAPGVTLRHLLSHTSELDSGLFPADCGEDDDALARWAEHLPGLGFVGAPGEVFSYSNAGVVLAGHVIERIEGRPWAALVRERVLEPLGIGSSWTWGERPRTPDVAGEHTTTGSFGPRGPAPTPWRSPWTRRTTPRGGAPGARAAGGWRPRRRWCAGPRSTSTAAAGWCRGRCARPCGCPS
jgi:CubicO group peptidase (beta-lactamase class C family)